MRIQTRPGTTDASCSATARRVSPREIHDKGLLLVRDAAQRGLLNAWVSSWGCTPSISADRGLESGATVAGRRRAARSGAIRPRCDRGIGALARGISETPAKTTSCWRCGKRSRTSRSLSIAVSCCVISAAVWRLTVCITRTGRRVKCVGSHLRHLSADGVRGPSRHVVTRSRSRRRALLAGPPLRKDATSTRRARTRRRARLPHVARSRGRAPPSSPTDDHVQPRNRSALQLLHAPEFQARAAEERGYHPIRARGHKSIALHAVVRDIAQRRAARKGRRRTALLKTLHDSWDRLYADHATIRAFDADRTLFARGRIPATWIADAASVAWMDNELGEPCLPCDLVVRTPEYLSAIGDEPAVFARGLDQGPGRLAGPRSARHRCAAPREAPRRTAR